MALYVKINGTKMLGVHFLSVFIIKAIKAPRDLVKKLKKMYSYYFTPR